MGLRRDLRDTLYSEIQRYKTDKLSEEELKDIEKDMDAFLVLEIRKHGDPGILERKAKEVAKRKVVIKEVLNNGAKKKKD